MPLICRELRKIIGRRQETIREKAKNEEHMMMLRFLKQQKAEIERQIKILEEESGIFFRLNKSIPKSILNS